MPVKLTCPSCQAKVPLAEPLPLPGDNLKCPTCSAELSVSYPVGLMDQLTRRDKRFASSGASGPPRAPLPLVPGSPRPQPTLDDPPTSATVHHERADEVGSEVATVVGPGTEVDGAANLEGVERTLSGLARPDGSSPLVPNAGPPRIEPRPVPPKAAPSTKKPAAAAAAPKAAKAAKATQATPKSGGLARRLGGAFGCAASSFVMAGAGLGALGLVGLGGVAGVFWHYGQDLPTVEALRAYQPPAVTVVRDRHGEVLGEIYDQRRYVLDLDQIPPHVQAAFLSAEDANFWQHGGIDYLGIGRAMIRNLLAGRVAQGGSTITQQVAKNFLLTNDRKLERKIKEVLLSWRIEEAYSKEHILYLYLNEIFLGSQAYGVEAASRTFFGKSVKDITVAEAAILAGLPPRPSDYNPHRSMDKAKVRQGYVLDQMVRNGHLTEAEAAAARAEQVVIQNTGNTFLEKAPHFTEHVRRLLVETYGEEMVLRGGLDVETTCDLRLQQVGQEAVRNGVFEVDQRMGFRREAITHLKSDAEISKKQEEIDLRRRKAWAQAQDAGGQVELPKVAPLVIGEVEQAVVLEVQPKWARVSIGATEAVLPLAWADWAYPPNPRMSWKSRVATDLTARIDVDGDGKVDEPTLQRGDVLWVRVEALDTRDAKLKSTFANTPGAAQSLVGARLWQDPEVESALLSMELDTGAVRAMIGGSDFTKSQFNRAVQSRRQVGSTFKPIVYAAAIETRKITAASIVPDAPLAFTTADDFIWKPTNYGHDYQGNMTLRAALAASKNTCTVRVLETIDPGMNDDVIYKFARKLGIGGPPSHTLPADHVPRPENDVLCPWIRETPESTICMDRFPPKDPELTNTAHRARMKPGDEYWCRACDLSMGLGSASLTMEEMIRAYSPFATDGHLIQPYYIERVKDRNGKVLEEHQASPPPKVMDSEVASIANWLLQGVVSGGTGSPAKQALGLQALAGKTGTTNEEKDTWFVGYSPEVITAVWVGFDQPKTLGVSSTGGRTALPIWIDYMKVAATKEDDRPWPMTGDIEYASIEEKTGRRVSSGGMSYPFIKGTAPESSGVAAGQVSLEEFATDGL